MAEVKWIAITTDIFDDEKILIIEQMPDHDSIIVIWFKLLALAGKINNGGVILMNGRIAYTDEMLSAVFRRPLNTVRIALKTFEELGMVEIINNTVTIPNWSKHQKLDKWEDRKAYMRNYMQNYRERQKSLANGEEVPVLPENTYDEEFNEIMDSKVNGEITVNPPSIDSNANVNSPHIHLHEHQHEHQHEPEKDIKDMAEYEIFFERIWELYPKKKGKSSISKSQKKELFRLGDRVITAIENYKAEIAKERTQEQYIKYGSTFFKTAYTDYLPENYKAVPSEPEPDEMTLRIRGDII